MQGTLCKVCTGCGRCTDVAYQPDILTKQGVPASWALEGRSFSMGTTWVTVDIGTTTVAMQLYDGQGCCVDSFVAVNPQRKYGADVISRITAAETEKNATCMQQMVRDVIIQGLSKFREQIGDADKCKCVIAGNVTMVYLFMGYPTASLGRAPFSVEHREGFWTNMGEIPCYVFPGVSAFVGGDIVAGIYADNLTEREELTLFLDLGTNGELALGNRHKVVACATAAGPAFEGGCLERVAETEDSNQTVAWGADILRIVAHLLQEGILDETGMLEEAYFEQGITVGGVCITQPYIRQLQLAKAAIATGIEYLLEAYGARMTDVERVVLAGGMGYYLNPLDAAAIGLLPQRLATKAISGGNTVLAGTQRFLYEYEQYGDSLTEILQERANRIQVFNIAQNDDFQDRYLAHINLQPWEE